MEYLFNCIAVIMLKAKQMYSVWIYVYVITFFLHLYCVLYIVFAYFTLKQISNNKQNRFITTHTFNYKFVSNEFATPARRAQGIRG